MLRPLASADAETAVSAGRAQEALDLAEKAVSLAQKMESRYTEGTARRAWGLALAGLEPPKWDEAEMQLATSLGLYESGQARLEVARTHLAWGIVCRDRGDLAAAREHWEQAAAQWEASGLADELSRTLALVDSLQLGATGGREASAQNVA